MSRFISTSGDTYMRVGGVLRNSGDGWHFIDDDGHTPDELTIGNVTSKYIQVLYPKVKKVIEFSAKPDETFAQPPYSAVFGPSVGLDTAYIYGTVSGTQFNPLTWSNSSANIWVGGQFLMHCLLPGKG